MLKVYSVIYRIMLVLAMLILFVAKFLVGAAGHNSDTGESDDIFIAYCIITTIGLTIYANIKTGKLKHILRFVNMLLVFVGVLVAGYMAGTIFYEGESILEMAIPLILVILFIITGIQLLRALIKDKPRS